MPLLWRTRRIVRYAWAGPSTLVGLGLVLPALVLGATVRRADGVLEVAGGRVGQALSLLPRPMRFSAITLGHVVIGIDHTTLNRLRPHEHVHVRQYERWGVLFFPLYLGSSVWQFVCGRSPYYDNRFEREAFATAAAKASADGARSAVSAPAPSDANARSSCSGP